MFMRRPSSTFMLVLAASVALPALAQAARYPRLFDTGRGGHVCYWRTYTKAFLKSHPNVKIKTLYLQREETVGGAQSTPNLFGLSVGAVSRGGASSEGSGICRTSRGVIQCDIEGDGGSFKVTRSGSGVVITTKRMYLEGNSGDVEIKSTKANPTRSFTLRGGGVRACGEILD